MSDQTLAIQAKLLEDLKPRETRKDRHKQTDARRQDRHKSTGFRGVLKRNQDLLCLDGEGVTIDEQHYYTLLVAGDGKGFFKYIRADGLTSDYLTSVQCLDFILSLPNNRRLFGFSLGYDITKWCANIPRHTLQVMFEKGHAIYRVAGRDYHLSYMQNRRFSVRLGKDKSTTRTIYDVFGFFQTSFVKTIGPQNKKGWEIGTPEEREFISRMKAERSTFTIENAGLIREYCGLECGIAVKLVETFLEACKEAGIVPKHLWGAGALGTRMLEIMKIKDYIANPPDFAQHAIACAYAGGRTDIAATGKFSNLHSYDINSAYPYAITSLPCLNHMNITSTIGYDPSKLAIWHLKWTDIKDCWPPFYVRDKHGIMHYPSSGEGWYWSIEAALPIEMYGDHIQVLDGILFEPGCDELPFTQVREWYDIRKEWKKIKPGAAQVLKLGLNSIYGKTAQTIGSKDGKMPAYHSLIWAGMITATCRAMGFRAVQLAPNSVISWATDGILSEIPLDLVISDNLGEWDYNKIDEAYIWQPGVYRTLVNGEWTPKNRGFGTSEVDWAEMSALLEAGTKRYTYKSRRFIGIGTAIHRNDFKIMGQWPESEREILFGSTRRYLAGIDKDNPLITWWKPEGRQELPSQPYKKTLRNEKQSVVESIRYR